MYGAAAPIRSGLDIGCCEPDRERHVRQVAAAVREQEIRQVDQAEARGEESQEGRSGEIKMMLYSGRIPAVEHRDQVGDLV
jgi:hypothetical protein